MVATTVEQRRSDEAVTLNRLRADLDRCVDSADRLGLTAIAIYLQRAVDELRDLSR